MLAASRRGNTVSSVAPVRSHATMIDFNRQSPARVCRVIRTISPSYARSTPSGLELTCYACPEQYDAFVDDRQVGYLRLRHGEFRVDCPNVGGETVYRSEPAGDGMFDDDERETELMKAKACIATWLLARTGFY
jgi:hypothetical protein